jgi:hypothetical protein
MVGIGGGSRGGSGRSVSPASAGGPIFPERSGIVGGGPVGRSGGGGAVSSGAGAAGAAGAAVRRTVSAGGSIVRLAGGVGGTDAPGPNCVGYMTGLTGGVGADGPVVVAPGGAVMRVRGGAVTVPGGGKVAVAPLPSRVINRLLVCGAAVLNDDGGAFAALGRPNACVLSQPVPARTIPPTPTSQKTGFMPMSSTSL